MPDFYDGVREQAKATNQSSGEAFHGHFPKERSGWWLGLIGVAIIALAIIAGAIAGFTL
jgi:hypothetical protein